MFPYLPPSVSTIIAENVAKETIIFTSSLTLIPLLLARVV